MDQTEVNAFIRDHVGSTDREISEMLAKRGIELGKGAVRARRRRMGVTKSNQAPEASNVNKIAELLKKSGIDPDEIDHVQSVRINSYQGMMKDNEGEARIIDMEAASLILKPKWAAGPEWPVIQAARPVSIKPVTTPRPERGAWKTAVILPDPQIGFRRDLVTGKLDPFHDERAMNIALQIIRNLRPDLIINLGDFLDFAEFGRFLQEPGFAVTTQASLDRGHQFLGEQRANAPEAEIRLIGGNHEFRLTKVIIENARAAFGLQRANLPESWPVLSVPNLLRLDELGVEYLDGYPAGISWINDRVACIHGKIVRSGASTAKAVVDDERVSMIFGHIHRAEYIEKTRMVREGPRFSFAASPGCLCRIDGTVPSTRGSIDSLGRAIVSWENWQQGIGIVTYMEGDGPFAYEHVGIYHGLALFRGTSYSSGWKP